MNSVWVMYVEILLLFINSTSGVLYTTFLVPANMGGSMIRCWKFFFKKKTKIKEEVKVIFFYLKSMEGRRTCPCLNRKDRWQGASCPTRLALAYQLLVRGTLWVGPWWGNGRLWWDGIWFFEITKVGPLFGFMIG